jgi:2'-5' RNA ligase
VTHSKRRLFFALWPDDTVRRRLMAAADLVTRTHDVAGRRIPAERVHLTLSFLGDQDADGERRAREAAVQVRAEPFDLTLDHAGSFHVSRAGWIGAARSVEPLDRLWLALVGALEHCSLAPDRRALAPHVTCWRNVRRRIGPVAVEPIVWSVREFVLVHSVLGAQPEYHVVSHWPLQTASMDAVKTVQEPGGPE